MDAGFGEFRLGFRKSADLCTAPPTKLFLIQHCPIFQTPPRSGTFGLVARCLTTDKAAGAKANERSTKWNWELSRAPAHQTSSRLEQGGPWHEGSPFPSSLHPGAPKHLLIHHHGLHYSNVDLFCALSAPTLVHVSAASKSGIGRSDLIDHAPQATWAQRASRFTPSAHTGCAIEGR